MTPASSRFSALLRFIRFGLVGAVTALIYFGLLVFFAEYLGIVAGVSAGGANILALMFNYWAHYVWTYQSKRAHSNVIPKFLLVSMAVLAINVSATAIIPYLFDINYLVVQFFLFCALVVATFVAQSHWIFGKKSN